MSRKVDVAVVGAGILGLACAYHLARRGLKVAVLERHPRAQGASVRNFGMIWPIGQPLGNRYNLARRSRELWLHVLRESGLWHEEAGSLHLAYHADEAQVLREFAAEDGREIRPCTLLTAAEVTDRFPAVCPAGLMGGLWSGVEMLVDPRQVIAGLPLWLQRVHGVTFEYDTEVLALGDSGLVTTRGEWRADRVAICTGADFRQLLPESFAESGLYPCKLQMMRTQPYGESFRLGTMLAGGLTLRHYGSFAGCPTLTSLAARLDAEMPEYGRYGIHVMAAQNGSGEVVIGDSHEYGDAIEPFDKARIDTLVLEYLRTFVTLPALEIASRWHGIYVKHPTEAFVRAFPSPGVLALTGVGGAGMTLSFGLAEQVITEWLGEPAGRTA